MIINYLLTDSLQDEALTCCNHSSAYQLNSVLQLHQQFISAIRVDDGQILYEMTHSNAGIDIYGELSWKDSTLEMIQSDSTLTTSNCGSSSAGAKGVTYPSQYDDVMAGMSY